MSAGRDGKHDEFERLLARAHRGRMTESPDCPDAATVAAYVDNGLDARERAVFERHAADCPRCAEAIALLAGIDGHSTAGATMPVRATWRWWRLLVPVATVLIVFVVWREIPPREDGTPVSDTSDSTPAGPAAARRAEKNVIQTDDAGNATTPKMPARKSTAVVEPRQEDKEVEPGSPDVKVEDQRKQAYAAPPSSASSDSAVSVYLGGAAPQGSAEDRKEAITVVPPPAPEAAAEAGSRVERRDEVLAKVAAPVRVTSADNGAVYRVVEGRTVQRSTDAGGTWVTEPTPVVADLRVGSAPSRDICWFAGAAGSVVRRSSDGTWHLVPLPQPQDIIGITATSAADAVATAANGIRWRTSDGGTSWEPL